MNGRASISVSQALVPVATALLASGYRFAVLLTTSFVAVIFGFGATVHAGTENWIEADVSNYLVFAVAFVLTLGAQAGLLLTPWACSREPFVRGVVATAMAPWAMLFGAGLFGAAQEFADGTFTASTTAVICLVASVLYAIAYVRLFLPEIRLAYAAPVSTATT